MDDQYGLPDLRHLMAARTHFPAAAVSQPLEPPPQPFSSLHRNNLTPAPPLQQPLPQSHHHHYDPLSLATSTNTASHHHHHHFGFSSNPFGGQDMEYGNRHDGGNSGRWPRQETLTLLEIRSRLDSKFREANQKGPLWDEVSRIMLEEHGYQRSGKKCREKFENLYKYYKKTKEGKAGRQDGKNYRFFRQLEAIYGEPATSHGVSGASDNHLLGNIYPTTNEANLNQTNREGLHDYKICDSLSFSNSSHEFETSSNNSENNEGDLSVIAFMMNQSMEKNKKRVDHEREESSRRCNRRGWKEKVKGFVDNEMRKVMEKQEIWMENIMKTIELREQERVTRELEWRKQEMARFDREHDLWAKEKEWIQTRDNALMEALKKFIGGQREQQPNLLSLAITKEHMGKDQDVDDEQNLSIEENNAHHHAVTSTRSTSASGSSDWTEPETLSLIQLRTSLEPNFFEFGYSSGDSLWELIAEKMACFGYNRTRAECKDKWESVRSRLNKKAESSKKYKDDMFH